MFIYRKWHKFCKLLKENNIYSVTAESLLKIKEKSSFLILKHDVETNPKKALKLAKIEAEFSHRGTYYVQGYLLSKPKNLKILKQIKDLGHEVTYHHDVMDSNKGDINKAEEEFQNYVDLFETNGFPIITVCQHGNPIMQRNGYHSNRDFFRNKAIKIKYNNITELMVDFKNRTTVNYNYISDAGYGWKLIYDPENNDIVDTSNKDVPIKNLNKVLEIIKLDSTIISTHPHRWNSNYLIAIIKTVMFKTIRTVVKILMKLPLFKKIFSKYYHLAKKI